MEAVNSNNGGLFFLEGCGGSGKTFVENTVLAKSGLPGKLPSLLCLLTLQPAYLMGVELLIYVSKYPSTLKQLRSAMSRKEHIWET